MAAPPPRSPSLPGSATLAMLVLMTAMVAIGPVSTDLYLPSLPTVGVALAATVAEVQLTLGVFMGGFALGTLIYGPVSDRFGRRATMLTGLGMFAAASLACAAADTISQLVAWRLAEGLAGAAAPIVSRAVVRDLYQREQAARVLSYMAGAMALAPAVAPVLGGWIHLGFGWRGHFWVLAGGGLLLLICAIKVIPETNLHRDPLALMPSRLLGNVIRLFRHPTFAGFAFTGGFAYGGLFSFISGGSFVLIGTIGVAPENFGFLFMIVAGSFVTGGFVGGRLVSRFGSVAMIRAGVWIGLIGGASGLTLSFFGVASIAAVVAPSAAVFFAFALVNPNCVAGAIAPFPEIAGTAASVGGFTQMATGAAIGSLVGPLFDGTARPMFAVMTTTMLLAVVMFYARLQSRGSAG